MVPKDDNNSPVAADTATCVMVLPSDMQWKKQDADVETDGGGEATFAGP
jgi:hypothetical protein